MPPITLQSCQRFVSILNRSSPISSMLAFPTPEAAHIEPCSVVPHCMDQIFRIFSSALFTNQSVIVPLASVINPRIYCFCSDHIPVSGQVFRTLQTLHPFLRRPYCRCELAFHSSSPTLVLSCSSLAPIPVALFR
jgi:hypothetical protein